MFTQIRKRDGRVVEFDPSKITVAIFKAGRATGEFDIDIAQRLTREVQRHLDGHVKNRVPEVEEIQDAVETVLMASPHRRTAKAYILYRDQHARIRDIKTHISTDIVDSYLGKLDWRVNENSNMAFSIQGLNNHISSVITSQYWLNKNYPAEIRDAHLKGDFHIHDLNILAVYCVGWDLGQLLREGFRGAQGKVESRPAKHLRTALGQIVNFFYTLQGEAAGAQAFSNFDTYLAPFIRHDGLREQEVKQALQEFVFNINVPTRVGFQTPFTNISLDLTVPGFLADQPVIIGGEPRETTYGEYQEELFILNRAFAEVMSEGDALGRVFTFPIPTYNITKDFPWEDKRLDPIWEMTAKYGIPYFSNFVNSDMNPEDARSMCCRLRLDNRTLRKRGGGLFGANPLTGSIGVVTLNLPRIGFLALDKSDFFSRLDHLMDLAVDSLENKRKILETFTDADLYPYARHYLSDIRAATGGYWTNHFGTIGLVGMNEACLNFLGKHLGEDIGRAFAVEVLSHMRERLLSVQEETGNVYNLEATPAEGTSYRLAMMDKEKYPNILCANEAEYRKGANPYYTNSSQLPVGFTDDLFEALDLQDELQTLYTGGTVFHGFIGERLPGIRSAKRLVRRVASAYRLPYFTLTPTFSVCREHGYIKGEQTRCPDCGGVTEVYSRVVGYLRPVHHWNVGKKSEFSDRRVFRVVSDQTAETVEAAVAP
ncbi:MAG TPA: ribonucleoside triphosphate reductase [bacterium]|nr:ribonucleoside triphosphate reductase [bacterium]